MVDWNIGQRMDETVTLVLEDHSGSMVSLKRDASVILGTDGVRRLIRVLYTALVMEALDDKDLLAYKEPYKRAGIDPEWRVVAPEFFDLMIYQDTYFNDLLAKADKIWHPLPDVLFDHDAMARWMNIRDRIGTNQLSAAEVDDLHNITTILGFLITKD
jgi:hypothetical protein